MKCTHNVMQRNTTHNIGDKVWHGDMKVNNQAWGFSSGTHILRFPANGYVRKEHFKEKTKSKCKCKCEFKLAKMGASLIYLLQLCQVQYC